MYRKNLLFVSTAAIFLTTILWIFSGSGNATTTRVLSRGQSVYVPIYSHIYHGNRERPFYLTATLSIRNTNVDKDITINTIDYYDSKGELIRRYIDKPILLKQFTSIRYVVNAEDTQGGSGAKFIVQWKSKEHVNTPLIEAIMIATQSQQGISFVSRGQAIKD
jgi:hypothetical protein